MRGYRECEERSNEECRMSNQTARSHSTLDIRHSTLHGGPGRRSHYRLGAWVGYWLGLFVINHIPVGRLGRLSFDNEDKIIHLVLYFLLVWLGGRYLFVAGRATSKWLLVAYAVLCAAYGAFDEWLQQYTHRTMSFTDWLADAAWIVLATIWLLYQRRSNTVPDPNR